MPASKLSRRIHWLAAILPSLSVAACSLDANPSSSSPYSEPPVSWASEAVEADWKFPRRHDEDFNGPIKFDDNNVRFPLFVSPKDSTPGVEETIRHSVRREAPTSRIVEQDCVFDIGYGGWWERQLELFQREETRLDAKNGLIRSDVNLYARGIGCEDPIRAKTSLSTVLDTSDGTAWASLDGGEFAKLGVLGQKRLDFNALPLTLADETLFFEYDGLLVSRYRKKHSDGIEKFVDFRVCGFEPCESGYRLSCIVEYRSNMFLSVHHNGVVGEMPYCHLIRMRFGYDDVRIEPLEKAPATDFEGFLFVNKGAEEPFGAYPGMNVWPMLPEEQREAFPYPFAFLSDGGAYSLLRGGRTIYESSAARTMTPSAYFFNGLSSQGEPKDQRDFQNIQIEYLQNGYYGSPPWHECMVDEEEPYYDSE